MDSEAVNSLSWPAEVLYRRLFSLADDYGRYDGRAEIIRTRAFPLKIDRVPVSDIGKWLDECSKAGLVRLYQVDNKPYLEIMKFDQTIRIKKSKYPAPASVIHMQADAKHMLRTCVSESKPIQTNPNQSGKETGEGEGLPPPPPYTQSTLDLIDPMYTPEDNLRECMADRSMNGFIETHARAGLSEEKLEAWLRAFNRKLDYEGVKMKKQKDYRQYFANWLKFQNPLASDPEKYQPVKTTNQQNNATTDEYLEERKRLEEKTKRYSQ